MVMKMIVLVMFIVDVIFYLQQMVLYRIDVVKRSIGKRFHECNHILILDPKTFNIIIQDQYYV